MDGAIHTGDYTAPKVAIAVVNEFPFSRSSVRSFHRGEVIAWVGALVDMFARVQQRLVSASTMLPDGREFIVEIIPKAGLIGELDAPKHEPTPWKNFLLKTPIAGVPFTQQATFENNSTIRLAFSEEQNALQNIC